MDLFEKLKQYAASDIYPFHMPGHKRQSGWKIDPYGLDVTEIEGFDNLHHPEGCLKDSMEWAAGVYGSDKTYYLVNGATCGILAAVGAAVPFGGKLVLARNAHKSAYHAVVLGRLKTAAIYPQKVDKLGIFGGICPRTVDNILASNPDARAVLVVSPTYDGVISDISAIAKVVHAYGIPLIVDEAHGAHLKFTSDYISALDCGADVVVQSLHKTLPALTQTALLHVKGHLIDTGLLERYLQIYQSSSPSYILLGSIEACIRECEARSPGEWDEHYRRVAAFRQGLKGLSAIALPGRDELKGLDSICDFDDSRLLISVRNCMLPEDGLISPAQRAVSGKWLADALRDRFHIETEMAAESYVVGISTPFDTDEGFLRLSDALGELDKELVHIDTPIKRRNPQNRESPEMTGVPLKVPEVCMCAADALDAGSETVAAENCDGRVAAEFAYLYPPGIPLMVPGERIDKNMLRTLLEWREKGFKPQGMADESAETIQVVKV